MSTTTDFVKLRSSGTPKVGEWNINFDSIMELAKKDGKPVIVCWSNGDLCSYCISAEKCMMDKVFKDWMKTSDCYFVFQYSGDKDKGKTAHDWIYKTKKIKAYPGFRVTCYDGDKTVFDVLKDGNTLRQYKATTVGAQNMVKNLTDIISKRPSKEDEKPDVEPTPQDYKIRLNETLTVKKINAILDAIDKNEGFCPCQVKDDSTKCHCEDFIKNKGLNEPCICKIYVKKAK